MCTKRDRESPLERWSRCRHRRRRAAEGPGDGKFSVTGIWERFPLRFVMNVLRTRSLIYTVHTSMMCVSVLVCVCLCLCTYVPQSTFELLISNVIMNLLFLLFRLKQQLRNVFYFSLPVSNMVFRFFFLLLFGEATLLVLVLVFLWSQRSRISTLFFSISLSLSLFHHSLIEFLIKEHHPEIKTREKKRERKPEKARRN